LSIPITTKIWLQYLSSEFDDSGSEAEAKEANERPSTGAMLFANTMFKSLSFRRFAITERGYMALVPEKAQAGDEIWIIAGMDVPSALRPAGGNSLPTDATRNYILVGRSYTHGIMMGEAWTDESTPESVVLV
jgi:hypothetical protein